MMALALVAALLVSPAHPSSHREPPCSQIRWERSVEARERLVRCAARRYDVDPETALRVARCESGPGLDPRAVYGSHRGIYQHRIDYWPDRAERYLSRWWHRPRSVSPFDALANVLVTMQMVTDRSIGWGPWSCY